MHARPVISSLLGGGGALALGVVALLSACGASPDGTGKRLWTRKTEVKNPAAAEPWQRLDTLHDVYIRGGLASSGARPRLALTVEGTDDCTDELLAKARAPFDGGKALPLTLFIDPAALSVRAAANPASTTEMVGRLSSEAHAVGLQVMRDLSGHRAHPAALRSALSILSEQLAVDLRELGWSDARPPLFWRGETKDPDLLSMSGATDRPLILQSLTLDVSVPETAALRLRDEARDGDIVTLHAPDGHCGIGTALPALARALESRGLDAVTVPTLLDRELDAYEVARVVRFDGPALSEVCRAALKLPAEPSGPGRVHFGLVDRILNDGATRVLPLPGPGDSSGRFQALGREVAERLWSLRAEWRALPACAVAVPPASILSPVTPDVRVYVVGDAGVFRRDARALGAPDHPVVFPTRAELARIESRQRLPWRLRGLVEQTLEQLTLELPLLVEARATTALVLRTRLEPSDADGSADARARLSDAVGGYVQLVEFSMGEYLFLSQFVPQESASLSAAARGGDGSLRAGPVLVLPGRDGSKPTFAHLASAVSPHLGLRPEELIARVLLSGKSLSPGDLVAVEPAAPSSFPEVSIGADTSSGRVALRRRLSLALRKSARSGAWLRPGDHFVSSADALGTLSLRVVAPAGVYVPNDGALPSWNRDGAD